MHTLIIDEARVHVPNHVVDQASFRNWLNSPDFPEQGRVSFLNGDVRVDMSKEQLFSHNQVKNEVAFVLTGIAKRTELGTYFPHGAFLTNVDADLSGQPDGLFIADATFTDGRIKLVEGAREGFVELEGSPDMVLEVVSDSSVEKDTLLLRDAYWQAGVREYWLIDARGDELSFEILKYTPDGYQEAAKSLDWLRSETFAAEFKLTRSTNKLGQPKFVLEVR